MALELGEALEVDLADAFARDIEARCKFIEGLLADRVAMDDVNVIFVLEAQEEGEAPLPSFKTRGQVFGALGEVVHQVAAVVIASSIDPLVVHPSVVSRALLTSEAPSVKRFTEPASRTPSRPCDTTAP
jgi:hypothetical protein